MTAEAPADAGRRRRGRVRSAPRHGRKTTAGAALRAPTAAWCWPARTDDTTGVDLTTGAVVRLRIDWTDEREADLAPFDIIDAAWADDPERDDLAQPEAVTVSGMPERIGTLRGRRARRLVRHLVAPEEPHLLGFPGSSAPYWEFHGMRPSVALVVPRRGPLLFRRRADGTVWARFGWPPQRQLVAGGGPPGHGRPLDVAARPAVGKGLSTALGFRPHFIVVVDQPATRRPLLQDRHRHPAPSVGRAAGAPLSAPCRRPECPRRGLRPWPSRRPPAGRRA